MAWKEVSIMSLREEFVVLAAAEKANLRVLCRRFGISRPTGYKWLDRYRRSGRDGLANASRRPHVSPGQTAAEVQEVIVALRLKHPAWGARKLRARLVALGQERLPAVSTIQAILARRGLVSVVEHQRRGAWERFEHAAPNELWQMDFKGHFALQGGARCHPLTVLDDHSRYALGLAACGNEQTDTVQSQLTGIFRRYGLPRRMLMDNGSPWRGGVDEPHSSLTVWLLRLGVGVTHGRPYHPQTQGKDERFHRTLKAEVLQWQSWASLDECQRRFDDWRDIYNLERPHEALGLRVPAARYQPSLRAYPETLPPIEYGPDDQVRKVSVEGDISFRGRSVKIGKALRSHRVALRPTTTEGVWNVWFCDQQIGELDQRVLNGRAAVPSFIRYAHERRHSESLEN